MARVFYAINDRILYKKQLDQIKNEVEMRQKFFVERKYMYEWLSATQESSIQQKMEKFHEMKTLRELFSAWRDIKDRKNAKRLRTYRIRKAFE